MSPKFKSKIIDIYILSSGLSNTSQNVRNYDYYPLSVVRKEKKCFKLNLYIKTSRFFTKP